MKPEQKVNSILLVVGAVVGIFSRMFNAHISLALGLLVYIVSLFVLRKVVRIKRLGWYFSNSLTYFLVWFLVWILLFNK